MRFAELVRVVVVTVLAVFVRVGVFRFRLGIDLGDLGFGLVPASDRTTSR